MGTPTPPVPPPGNPAERCDGVLWPAGSPPKFVEVDLWDLVKCPICPYEPPNGKFWLEQSAIDPWRWAYEDSLYNLSIEIAVDETTVGASSAPGAGNWVYFADAKDGCQYDFTNQWTICLGNLGSVRGEWTIYWPGP